MPALFTSTSRRPSDFTVSATARFANSANLTPLQIEDSITTAQSLLQSGAGSLAVVHPVTCDLHAVAFELQPNLAR